MMVKPIRLKKQKQIGEPTPIPYPNLEEGMEVLYLPIQSKSEDSSSSLVCFFILFNDSVSFLFCTIQLRFTNTSTRSTTIAITIKNNGTKFTSITYSLSFPYKDRRSNKVNSISFIESFQIIISITLLIYINSSSHLRKINI